MLKTHTNCCVSCGVFLPWLSEVLYNHVCSCQLRGGVFNITFTWQAFQNHVCCFQFGAKVSLIASASGISRAKAFKRMSDAFTFCKNSKVRKKWLMKLCNLPACLERKVRKKWLMKLCKDRVSNFDAGLWHFLQENLPAANASKPKPFATTEKFEKNAYETLQGSRVEFRRRTLALPVERKPSSRKCLKAQTLCNNRKVRKKLLMKLCKDRVSNFDAGLWHFLQENLPAANASKPKPFATTEKFEKKWLVKLCKDRVSNFDAGLWHFLQENLPAANASKPKPFATTEKFEKKWLMKLCKDRVSNFDAGLWHYKKTPAVNASKPKPFARNRTCKSVRLGVGM